MINAFIKIRIKQFYRGLIDIGWFRLLFLVGLLGFFGFMAFVMTSTTKNAFYVSGLMVLIVLLIHAKRQDKIFLKTNFTHYTLICIVEYLLLSSIIITFLMVHFQWLPILCLLFAIILLVHFDLKVKHRNLNSRLQQFIPSESFEWKGGVRQTLFILVPLWVIGLCTSFFIGSVPIVLFLLGIIPFSFYEKGEPYQLIVAYEMGTKQFLFHKIKMQVGLFSVLALPLIVAFLVFHIDNWYIPLVEYLIFISLYIYLIFAKYAFYEPNSKSGAAQVFNAIGTFCGIVPVLLPVVWLLSIKFYFKSKESLNIYLNDYN
jgi:hypothetical protein